MKILISNLNHDVPEEELLELVGNHGRVLSVITDTNSSKGFAYVEMSSNEEGKAVINALNGMEFHGKALRVVDALSSGRSSADERSNQGGGGDGGGRLNRRVRNSRGDY